MASNYPTSIDSFTDPLSNSPLNSPSHAGQHQDINDAVEKLETKLGTGSSPAASATNGQLLVKGATDTSWQPITSVSSGAAANRAVLAANGTGGAEWNANVGLWLVKTQTIGTGVSSQTVTNCFSSAYDAYRVVVSNAVGSTSQSNVSFQFLPTSTTGYNTSYYGMLIYAQWATGTYQSASDNDLAQFRFIANVGTNFGNFSFDVINPFNNRFSAISSNWTSDTGAGNYTGRHQQAQSYTGFTIAVSGTTMTGGTIRVYGYNNG